MNRCQTSYLCETNFLPGQSVLYMHQYTRKKYVCTYICMIYGIMIYTELKNGNIFQNIKDFNHSLEFHIPDDSSILIVFCRMQFSQYFVSIIMIIIYGQLQQLSFIDFLPCSSHWAKHLTHFMSFNLHKNHTVFLFVYFFFKLKYASCMLLYKLQVYSVLIHNF